MQQGRDSWLKERKGLLTASDVSAIIGENPFKTNIDVYIDKITGDICQTDKDHLKFGRDVEGAIAQLYQSRTDNIVEDPGATTIIRHPDIDWLGATLDRRTIVDDIPFGYPAKETKVPLELKHVGGFGVYKDEWVADPPGMYQIQSQIQCACDSAPFAVLAGMFPGYQLGYKEIKYSQEFMDAIFPVIDEFWNHNVKKKIPPELIEHGGNLNSVKRLFNKDDGQKIDLDDDYLSLVWDWEEHKKLAKQNQEIADSIQARLRHKMGEAAFGALPDGRFLTLKTTSVEGYEKKVEAYSFRTLRIAKRIK